MGPTQVPSTPPQTTERILPGAFISNTMIGMPLSLHRLIAVLSMT